MPTVTDPPLVPLDTKLLELRTALDAEIPAKQLDRTLLPALGPNCATIMTDVTRGKAGNNERMAFVFVPIGELEKTALSWKISDRYPLWTEFSVR